MMSAHAAGRLIRLALILVAATAASAAQLEDAAPKAAEITKQAKDLGTQSAKEASAAKRSLVMLASYQLEAGGSIKSGEWRLVYSGQSERCYTITFTDRQGVPGYPDSYRTLISVYTNGELVENLSNPGDSTSVCGTKIHLKGFCYDQKGTSFWSAVERRP